jgi:redox-sensitive bicupin YhaK (pirin superfamily)
MVGQSKLRPVVKKVDALRTREGAGFLVNRPFPIGELSYIDPFLLLDEMGPEHLGPRQAKGAPNHPHRGFETVTYMIEGTFVHKDSNGNHGILRPGDVQWMTAGSGLIHDEMPEQEFFESGGMMHGFQLWVNLPAAQKFISPRYQDTPSEKIPVVSSDDGLVKIKVIAGKALGHQAVIETRTEISYLHFTLSPGAIFEQPIPPGHNAFAYVFGGALTLADEQFKRGQMAIFGEDGFAVSMTVDKGAKEEAQLLLLSGAPINEQVSRYGPFVMNTPEQIMEAMRDFQDGKMGRLKQ